MAKAKGTTVIGTVKFLRHHREDAVRVLPEELQHYLNEMVQPAQWYPEEDAIGLIRAMVELMPGDREEALERTGVASVRDHGDGIYSHLLSGRRSKNTTRALWSSMHDTGRLEIDREDANIVRMDLIDYAAACPEMCTITGAYMRESIRMAGKNATMEKIECVLHGDDKCSWRYRW